MRNFFFEFVNAQMTTELQIYEDIINIDNTKAAKVATESSADAIVEYCMDITFITNGVTHPIKLTAYLTTCQLMFQPMF